MRRKDTARVFAEMPQPSETTNQQRLEGLKQLADIFADIFSNLTLEKRADYMLVGMEQKAA